MSMEPITDIETRRLTVLDIDRDDTTNLFTSDGSDTTPGQGPALNMALTTAFPACGTLGLYTCERVVLVLAGDPAAKMPRDKAIIAALAADAAFAPVISNVEPDAIEVLVNKRAVRFLQYVCAGLESNAPGETQIRGQLAAALDQAIGAGGTSARAPLAKLVREILEADKAVRAESGLNANGSQSWPRIALSIAHDDGGLRPGARIVLIGAGEIAAEAAMYLRPIGEVSIYNRTKARAEELAVEHGFRVIRQDELGASVAAADVVVVASPVVPEAVLMADLAGRITIDLTADGVMSARAVGGATVVGADQIRAVQETVRRSLADSIGKGRRLIESRTDVIWRAFLKACRPNLVGAVAEALGRAEVDDLDDHARRHAQNNFMRRLAVMQEELSDEERRILAMLFGELDN
ncbi:MAG: hypothetical protein AAFZ67_08455 [Planctomycetota bacterium]